MVQIAIIGLFRQSHYMFNLLNFFTLILSHFLLRKEINENYIHG
jgi:hypothetical protein